MADQQLDCALDLMRRLPPQQCERNLSDLIQLVPQLCDELLGAIDLPLKIAKDKENGKEYLLSDYNRDGDSYRSPWSNKYDPPLDDGTRASEKARRLEIDANGAFESYKDMYFEGGISSVYVWDREHGDGFNVCVLIKKAGDGSKMIKGCWDSVHVMECACWLKVLTLQEKQGGRQAHYKLTSTIMLWLQTSKATSGLMNLGGSLTRQHEADHPVNEANTHLANIGRMVEECESKIRATLNEIYFGKTKQIVSDLRSIDNLAELDKRGKFVDDLKRELIKQRQTSKDDN